MTQALIGKWGESLAIRVPPDVAEAAGLRDGERVEIEVRDGEIHVRRQLTDATKASARRAVEEMIEDSRGRTLGGLSIRELIDEGRK